MSAIAYLLDRDIQVSVTQNGGLNLKGLSFLSDATRVEVLTFARQNKQQIIFELEPPPPNLSRIQPEDRAEYTTLWYHAHELADYVDGNTAPYEERIEKLPELNMLNARMTELELKIKANPPTQEKQTKPENTREYWDSMIRCPVGTQPDKPITPKQDTCQSVCQACGQSTWWRADEPNSKWICGRCHPPAAGLDVVFAEHKDIY